MIGHNLLAVKRQVILKHNQITEQHPAHGNNLLKGEDFEKCPISAAKRIGARKRPQKEEVTMKGRLDFEAARQGGYHLHLRKQAEDVLRSWGWVKKSDGTWGEPEPNKISASAVIRRINRKLEANNPGEFVRIKKTRSSRAQQDLGDFYLHNGNRNFVQDTHLDLNEVAKQYKVLSSTEQVEQKA